MIEKYFSMTEEAMIDHLKNNGYHIFYEDNVYKSLSSNEIATELKGRGHYYREMSDNEIKEEAESRGFYVSYHDERVEILTDIYRHATWMHNSQMQTYLNGLFAKYLNKWL